MSSRRTALRLGTWAILFVAGVGLIVAERALGCAWALIVVALALAAIRAPSSD